MSPFVKKFLIHLGKLAGLSAALAVVVAVGGVVAGVNVAALPVYWQGIATLVLPLVVSAINTAKADLAAELAAEEAATANAKVAELQAKLAK